MMELHKMTARAKHVVENGEALNSGSAAGGGLLLITAELAPSGSDLDVLDTIKNPSHTLADVKAAMEAGMICILKLKFTDGVYYYMHLAAEQSVGVDGVAMYLFVGIVPDTQLSVTVEEDGWKVYTA